MNQIAPGFCGAIGNTPLIRLETLGQATGCEILGKAEFMNPGGSVKDRAALGIITAAEKEGLIKPGGLIVEGTAGNTGIGLALVGNSRGYRTLIVIPETQSREKIETLRAMGAEVRTVPEAPYSDPNNYNRLAERLASEMPNAFWANQFDNTANRTAHYQTTGPEIWEQTDGKVTGFVASVGTGGTLGGTSAYLKERNSGMRIACADPCGAAMFSWFQHGTLEDVEGDSHAEGIGLMRVTKNIENAAVDHAYRISDRSAIEMLYHLLRQEGLFLSLSSAINVCGAVKLAKEQGAGQTIVTILCDSGARYLSKLYSPEWLSEQDLTPRAKDLNFLEGI